MPVVAFNSYPYGDIQLGSAFGQLDMMSLGDIFPIYNEPTSSLQLDINNLPCKSDASPTASESTQNSSIRLRAEARTLGDSCAFSPSSSVFRCGAPSEVAVEDSVLHQGSILERSNREYLQTTKIGIPYVYTPPCCSVRQLVIAMGLLVQPVTT